MLSFIQDFGVMLIIVVALSFAVKLFRQPIIVGYVLSGMFLSFLLLKGTNSGELIIIMSELGITFLLFLMGLEFDFKNLKHLGKDIFIVTLIQTMVFFAIAFIPAMVFGFGIKESVYLSILFVFSSTLLVAKVVEDKKESTTLRGKMILGILVVQDLFAIFILTVLSVMQKSSFVDILLVPVGGIILFGLAFVFARYILNALLKIAVRYPELLFIFGIGMCFLFALISPILGYSTTIGAFVAGVTLANTHYKSDIHGRLKPLIIFFNMLFFVGLGYQMKLSLSLDAIFFIIFLCVISVLLKPIVIYLTLRIRGYDLKTSFIAGLDLAQMSEFGIIIIAGGVISGQLNEGIATIATICVILSMVISSYITKYDLRIFSFFEKRLQKIDKIFRKNKDNEESFDITEYDVVFFGYQDINKEIVHKFEGLGKKILVIDNDPANIELLKEDDTPYLYNTVADPYFFNSLDFKNTELVISSLFDLEENEMIIKHAKHDNPKVVIITTAKSLKHSIKLYDIGADYVIYPTYINEQYVSVLLEDYTTDINKIITKKVKELPKFKEMDKKREHAEAKFDINGFLEKLSKKERMEKKERLKAMAEPVKIEVVDIPDSTTVLSTKDDISKPKLEVVDIPIDTKTDQKIV